MLDRVGVRITTLGAGGARIERKGEPVISVPAVPDAKPVDPTGSGERVPFRLPGRRGLGACRWSAPLSSAT